MDEDIVYCDRCGDCAEMDDAQTGYYCPVCQYQCMFDDDDYDEDYDYRD